MVTMIEQFQQINQELTGSKFVQKYEWLGKIIKNKNEINVIELILSFQFNGKYFTGTDKYIAHRISVSQASVNDILKRLDEEGMIQRNTGFNGKSMRRERTIKVNTQHLVNVYNTLKVGQDLNLIEDYEEYNSVPTTTTQGTKKPENSILPKNPSIETIEVSDDALPIPLVDFDVKKALIHYLGFNPNDNDIINCFDQEFIKHRIKNNLKGYNLSDLIDFFNHHLDGNGNKGTIIKRITTDIDLYNKINELTSA